MAVKSVWPCYVVPTHYLTTYSLIFHRLSVLKAYNMKKINTVNPDVTTSIRKMHKVRRYSNMHRNQEINNNDTECLMRPIVRV